jgi:hypothetical protein
MKQVTTRGPTHSCRALQSRTTQLRSGLLVQLRSIELGFFQPAFLTLPTWRIHASPLRPLACLRTLITAGGKHCPLHSHTKHPQERKPELCTRNTQFTNPKEHTHTHTQETQEVVGRSEEFKRGWESGYYEGIVDANGAQDRSQPYQTQAQGMLFVSRKYKSTALLTSLSLSLSLVV